MSEPEPSLASTGLALLQPLLRDQQVRALFAEGTRPIYVERSDGLHDTAIRFESDAQLLALIQSLAASGGIQLHPARPVVEVSLPSGHVLVAVIPPVTAGGPVVMLRKPLDPPEKLEQTVADNGMSRQMLSFLEGVMRGPINVLVTGNRGSDLPAFLAALIGAVPIQQRVALVEPLSEMRISRPRTVRLQARSAAGAEAMSYDAILQAAARLRPDRIVASDMPEEAFATAVRLATQGQTFIATMHATSPADALFRIETAIQRAWAGVSPTAVRRSIANSLDLVVQRSRLPDGSRRIVAISQIANMDRDDLSLEDIFVFKVTGIRDGEMMGAFEPTGVVPRFDQVLRGAGVELSPRLFQLGGAIDPFFG